MPRLWPVGLIVISALGSQLPGLDGWTQIHTSNDHIPDSATNPTISSSANGLWSSPATWIPSRVPLSSDRVRITLAVTFDGTAVPPRRRPG